MIVHVADEINECDISSSVIVCQGSENITPRNNVHWYLFKTDNELCK